MCCKRAGGEPGWPGTQNTGTELHVSKQAKVSEPQQAMNHEVSSLWKRFIFPKVFAAVYPVVQYQMSSILQSVRGCPPQLCHRESHHRPHSGASSCGERQIVRDCCSREHCWWWLLECQEGLSKERGEGGAAPTEQCKASSRR